MRSAVLNAPQEIPVKQSLQPTLSNGPMRSCGSDLWDCRGPNPVAGPSALGYEYCGVVEEVGARVPTVKPEQFVAAGQRSCEPQEFITGRQAEAIQVPLADSLSPPSTTAPWKRTADDQNALAAINPVA